MSVRAVGATTHRDFSREEVDELRHDRSTSAVLNEARRGAGQKGNDVAVRGDDGTLDDKLGHNKKHLSVGKVIAVVADAAHLAEGLEWIHVGGHGMRAGVSTGVMGAAIALPVAGWVGSQVAMAEMQDAKDSTRDAATRDVMRAGMLLSLELPSGFVDGETTKLGVGTTGQAPAKKLSDQLKGTPLGATLQLHCDQGVHAAQDCLASGRSQAEHFAANPKLAERYASDAAFRAGFDAFVWASKEAPADAKQMDENVKARDARYQSAGVPVRA
jgi:hypothetical protein